MNICCFSFTDLKEMDDDDDSFEITEKIHDTERYLCSLYGSLSSTMKHVHQMYHSKSSQLM